MAILIHSFSGLDAQGVTDTLEEYTNANVANGLNWTTKHIVPEVHQYETRFILVLERTS